MTDKLNAKDRRKAVAELVSVTMESIEVKLLADMFDVTTKTIYCDLKSEDVANYVLDEVKSQMKGEGIALAWSNIKRALVTGDVPTSRWLLEKCEAFKGGSSDKWDRLLDDLYDNEGNITVEAQGDNGFDPGEAEPDARE